MKTTLSTLLAAILLSCSLFAAGPDKLIKLSPEIPVQSWSAKLAKFATAKLNVTIVKEGQVAGVTYELLTESITVTLSPPSGVSAWTGSMSGLSGEFAVVNTAQDDTESVVTIKCTWQEKRIVGAGGVGPAARLKTIEGSAEGRSKLGTSTIQWYFDTDKQLADNASLINWRIEAIDEMGKPTNVIVSGIVPVVADGAAAWFPNPNSGTGVNVQGTLRANAVSNGILKATYKFVANGTDLIAESAPLSFFNVTFGVLLINQVQELGLYGAGVDLTGAQLIRFGAAVTHLGSVKVDPPTRSADVEVRLVQYGRGEFIFQQVLDANTVLNGEDVKYSAIPQIRKVSSTGFISVTSSDKPGLVKTTDGWLPLSKVANSTGDLSVRFQLYLQVKVVGAPTWKTLAKRVWGLQGLIKANVAGDGLALTPGLEGLYIRAVIPTNEAPAAPASKAPPPNNANQ